MSVTRSSSTSVRRSSGGGPTTLMDTTRRAARPVGRGGPLSTARSTTKYSWSLMSLQLVCQRKVRRTGSSSNPAPPGRKVAGLSARLKGRPVAVRLTCCSVSVKGAAATTSNATTSPATTQISSRAISITGGSLPQSSTKICMSRTSVSRGRPLRKDFTMKARLYSPVWEGASQVI